MQDSDAEHTVVPSRMLERVEETREALIAAARQLFGQRGFAAVGTEEIARTARVTRGALYHHFKDKKAVFRAVYEAVEKDLVQQLAATAASAATPIDALRAGSRAFLDACEDPAVQRIALIDAPSVLGWEEWREIGMSYGLGLVQATLQGAMDADMIFRQPVRPLAHLLLGSIDEAGMLVARADDGGQTKREVAAAIDHYLDALVGVSSVRTPQRP
jgi:AcrR family transcriptional regulator